MMVGTLPQYISMFIVGLIAYRRGWLTKIPDAVGKRWFWVALMDLLFFVLLFVLNAMAGLGGSTDNFMGGLHWQALVFAFWETIMCGDVYMPAGLLPQPREPPRARVGFSFG
jgi:hypothetical protein